MRTVIVLFSVLSILALVLSACAYFSESEECRDPRCLDEQRLQLQEFHTLYTKEQTYSGAPGEGNSESSVEVWEKGEKARYHFKPAQGEELVGVDFAGNILFCLGQNDSFYCENVPFEDDFFIVSDFTTPYLLPLFPKAKDPAAIKGLPPDEFDFFMTARTRLFDNLVYAGKRMQLGEESLCFALKEGHDLPNTLSLDICYHSNGIMTSYTAEILEDGRQRRDYIELKTFETTVDDDVFTLPGTIDTTD